MKVPSPPSEKLRSQWWRTHSPREEFPRLSDDMEVDVVVIGAGITGLTAAVELVRRGQRVVILEKDRVGSGTSGGTSAHLATLWDVGYSKVEKEAGLEGAAGMASALREAIDFIERNAQHAPDRADFKRLPGYLFAEGDQSLEDVETEGEICARLGLAVFPMATVPEWPAPVKGAFRIENQARFHPLKYLDGLTADFVRRGGRIFEDTAVHSVDPIVKTEFGSIQARHVIYATHTPLGINAVHTTLTPSRSYMLAVEAERSLPDALYWDSAEPYNYVRIGDSRSNLLLVGGRDHLTGEGDPEAAYEDLSEYVRRRFGLKREVARWSAQIYDPSDARPIVGQSPFHDAVWIATGFSGDGLTCGTFAGILLAREIVGEADERAALFSPRRLDLVTTSDFVTQNFHVARRMVADRIPKQEVAPDELRPGEGTVVQTLMGGRAYFRTEAGDLRGFSAVCPHLHCVVHWNGAERSFDCPCHGSRFDGQGRVIEGPAFEGLKPIKDSSH